MPLLLERIWSGMAEKILKPTRMQNEAYIPFSSRQVGAGMMKNYPENHSGMICTKRTQDLERGFDDEYCKDCWIDSGLSDWYADREECYEENVITEAEFGAMVKQRKERHVLSYC